MSKPYSHPHKAHEITLKAIEVLIAQDPPKDTPQFDFLNDLAETVQKYEAVCWPKRSLKMTETELL